MVDPPADRTRRRGTLLVLLSLSLLLQPVVGNGPAPDPATVYEGDPVDTTAEPPEGALTRHPAVSGDFTVTTAVRAASNGTYRPNASAPPGVRDLRRFEFFWAESEGQYYAVDARVRNGTVLLDSRPVSAAEVAAAVAAPAAEVDEPVRRAARTGRAYADHGERSEAGRVGPDPVLVATDDGYALVTRRRGTAPDPLRWPKLAGYALAGAGVVLGVMLHTVGGRRRGG